MGSSSEDEDYYGDGAQQWSMELDGPSMNIFSRSSFCETYQFQSVLNQPSSASSSLRHSVQYGNKIIMPASALDKLSRLNVMYPMMFRISSCNDPHSAYTHCGVLEFSAPEGLVYLPPWIISQLNLRPSGATAKSNNNLITISNVSLPLGTFIKIQPQSVEFLDITDPRAVLEHSLRNFATLSKGDLVEMEYNGRVYGLKVLEVKPDRGGHGICVLETDLQVDFAPPPGYQEPNVANTRNSVKSIASSLGDANNSSGSPTAFTPFSGNPQKLSDRPKTMLSSSESKEQKGEKQGDVAGRNSTTTSDLNTARPLNLPKGTLFFGGSKPVPPSNVKKEENSSSTTTNDNTPSFTPFSGTGRRLQ